MIDWQAVVALAREVDQDHANGVHNPTNAERLARAVLDFQARLSPGVRDSRPRIAAAPVVPELDEKGSGAA
jgi:hypothetical protein